MAHFLRGRYRGLYQAGSSECVRDLFRFRQVAEGRISMEVTRRDLESVMGRYWRYDTATINLIPIDESNPRLGGKVHVKGYAFDFRTFTPQAINQYGVYNDQFVSFGTFNADAGNPLDNEELLLSVVDNNNVNENVVDVTTFIFENNQLSFEREVNGDLADTEINHAVERSNLATVNTDSWTETFFYGLGNRSV